MEDEVEDGVDDLEDGRRYVVGSCRKIYTLSLRSLILYFSHPPSPWNPPKSSSTSYSSTYFTIFEVEDK